MAGPWGTKLNHFVGVGPFEPEDTSVFFAEWRPWDTKRNHPQNMGSLANQKTWGQKERGNPILFKGWRRQAVGFALTRSRVPALKHDGLVPSAPSSLRRARLLRWGRLRMFVLDVLHVLYEPWGEAHSYSGSPGN